jgi:hypothetical protein
MAADKGGRRDCRQPLSGATPLGTRQRFFLKKILCQVPPELFFVCFWPYFFLEPWYSNYNSISKFGTFFIFYTIFL